jgi:ABC-type phosphate transport system permease subunit
VTLNLFVVPTIGFNQHYVLVIVRLARRELVPKDIGTYVVEFRRAEGETLAISMPRGETDCVQTLQGLDALTGLVVQDVKTG